MGKWNIYAWILWDRIGWDGMGKGFCRIWEMI
jgi:hypothetical protein